MGSSCSRDSVTKPTNDFHIDEIDAVKRKEEDREKAEYEAMIAEEAKREKEASSPPPESASPIEKKYAYGWGSESDPKRVIRRDSAPMTQQVGMIVEQLDDDEEDVETQEEIEARKKRADNITDLFASYKQNKTPVTRSTHVPITKTMAIEPLPINRESEKDKDGEKSSLAFLNFRTAASPSPLITATPSSTDPVISPSPSHAFARRSSLSSTPSGARQLPALNHTTKNTIASLPTVTSTETTPSHKPTTSTSTSTATSISVATSTSSAASSATSSLPDSLSAFTMAASSTSTSAAQRSSITSSPIPARKSISSTTSTHATSPPPSTCSLAHSPLQVQRKASLTSLHHPRATTMAASSILSSSSSSTINHSTSTSTSSPTMNHSTSTSSLHRPSGFARMGAASLGTVS